MRVNKYLKLHQRCTDCLDSIIKCDNAISTAESDLRRYKAKSQWDKDTSPWVSESGYIKQITRYTAIRKRLIKWYAEMFERLQAETHEFREQTLNIGTLQLTPEQKEQAEIEQDNTLLSELI